MGNPEPKWKVILAWVGIVWGALVVLKTLFSQAEPGMTQAYVNGQYAGILFAFIVVCAAASYLYRRPR